MAAYPPPLSLQQQQLQQRKPQSMYFNQPAHVPVSAYQLRVSCGVLIIGHAQQVDILDRDGFYEVRMEMPGVHRKCCFHWPNSSSIDNMGLKSHSTGRDVHIDVYPNGLMVRAQPSTLQYWNKLQPIRGALQQQRSQDPVEEWVPLPYGCNLKRARAKLFLGVLNIKVRSWFYSLTSFVTHVQFNSQVPKHVCNVQRNKGYMTVG